MNHKRGRAKNQRAGCLLCKPHKANGCGRSSVADQRATLDDVDDLAAWPSAAEFEAVGILCCCISNANPRDCCDDFEDFDEWREWHAGISGIPLRAPVLDVLMFRREA